MDLEKMAFVECCESSDAVVTFPYGSGISPVTGYIRKVSLQPAELWLAPAHSAVVDNDQFDVLSPEVKEVSAAKGFVRYVESASSEPLEYWLRPGCELEFPVTDETSYEDVAAEGANCTWTEPKSNPASVMSWLERILCKPDSFWLMRHNSADGVSDSSMEFDSPLCSPPGMPHTNAIFNDPLMEQGIFHSSDFWPPKSYCGDLFDKTGDVINDDNDMAVNFQLESAIKGSPSGKVASSCTNSYYFAILKSKPANYWLCNGYQKLPLSDSEVFPSVL